MRIEVNKTVQVTDLTLARELILAALRADKCRVTAEDPKEVVAKRGSQAKMRTLGGMMVNLKVLPVALTVSFDASAEKNVVTLHAYDTAGFGTIAGIYEKYAQAVEDLATVALSSVQGIVISSKQSETTDSQIRAEQVEFVDEVNFCSTCGKKFTSGASFCASCGSPRTGLAATNDPVGEKNAEKQSSNSSVVIEVDSVQEEVATVVAVYKGKDVEKSKGGAVVLAIFLGFWTWLYTYGKRDAWKFWTGAILCLVLGVPLIPLYGLGIVVFWAVSIWAIIDVAIKPVSYYQDFYSTQLSRSKR